jgi:dGTPase
VPPPEIGFDDALRNARELGDLGRRFLEGRQPGLEAQLANLADAVAYNNHDVDDGYRAGLLRLEQLREQPLFGREHDAVMRDYPGLEERRLVYEVIRRMIGHLVADLIETTRAGLDAVAPASIDDVRNQPEPIVRFSDGVHEQHVALKRFLYRNLYRHEKVRVMTDRAKETVKFLFDRYLEQPEEMGADFSAPALAAGSDRSRRARVVADYIAGMTDRFAIREHERLAL